MSRIGRTAFLHFLAQIVVSIAGFAGTFIIARLLGAGPLGTFTVAMGLGYFWLIIPSNAVCSAIVKRMSERNDRASNLGSGIVLNLLLAVILGSGVYVTGSLLPRFADSNSNEFIRVLTAQTELLVLLVVGSVIFNTAIAALNGEKRVGTSGGLKAVERTVRVILQMGFVLTGYAVGGLILATALSLLTVALLGFYITGTSVGRPSIQHIRLLTTYARYSWLGTLKSRTFGWMDTIVLSFFVSSSLIGIYEVAWGLASLLGVASASIRTTLFPELSDLHAHDDMDRVRHLLNEGLAFNGIFIIPGLIGSGVIGSRVLRIYGAEFVQGSNILVILVAGYILNVFGGQLIAVLGAIDRPDVAFRLHALFVVSNIVLNISLVAMFGWIGAAVATGLSSGILLVGGFVAVVQTIGRFEVPTTMLGVQTVAALGMGAVVYWLNQVVPQGMVITVALVLVGSIVYGLFLTMLSRRIRTKALMLIRDLA